MAGNSNSGRRRKPAALRVYEGNRSKTVIPDEIKPRPKFPSCPRWMAPEGRRMWSRIRRSLGHIPGLVTEADWLAMQLACDSYAEWMALREDIRAKGRTKKTAIGPMERPEIRMAERARKALDGYLSRFGMSPTDRARLAMPKTKRAEESLLDAAV